MPSQLDLAMHQFAHGSRGRLSSDDRATAAD